MIIIKRCCFFNTIFLRHRLTGKSVGSKGWLTYQPLRAVAKIFPPASVSHAAIALTPGIPELVSADDGQHEQHPQVHFDLDKNPYNGQKQMEAHNLNELRLYAKTAGATSIGVHQVLPALNWSLVITLSSED